MPLEELLVVQEEEEEEEEGGHLAGARDYQAGLSQEVGEVEEQEEGLQDVVLEEEEEHEAEAKDY